MNPFDMVAASILAFCLVRGIFRGLIKELSSIVGVLAGFYAGYNFYPAVADLLESWIPDPGYLNIVSFMALFCAIFFIISVIGVVIKYLLNIAFMGWFDRICGACFGLVKAVLTVSVLFVVFTAFLPKGSPFVGQSLIGPHLTGISENMVKLVSKDMKRQFRQKIKESKHDWNLSK
jgi:membrane protein required for colicin V production